MHFLLSLKFAVGSEKTEANPLTNWLDVYRIRSRKGFTGRDISSRRHTTFSCSVSKGSFRLPLFWSRSIGQKRRIEFHFPHFLPLSERNEVWFSLLGVRIKSASIPKWSHMGWSHLVPCCSPLQFCEQENSIKCHWIDPVVRRNRVRGQIFYRFS